VNFSATNNRLNCPAAQEIGAKRVSTHLRVICAEEFPLDGVDAPTSRAYVGSPAVFAEHLAARSCVVFPHTYPNTVISLATHPGVPDDAIVLNDVQRHTCGAAPYHSVEWSLHDEQEPLLTSVQCEIRPRERPDAEEDETEGAPAEGPPVLTMDAAELVEALGRHWFQQIITLGDITLVEFQGELLVARVVGLHAEGEDDEEGVQLPDTRRGVLDAETVLYVTEDAQYKDCLTLRGAMAMAEAPLPKNSVEVKTNDEEWFPVRSKLLQPCIKLTSAVMAGHGVHKEKLPSIEVDVDCLTMDRVLQYLEAAHKGEDFSFDLEYNEEMLNAARTLGCAGLEDDCLKQTGAFEQRVNPLGWRFSKVQERNASGEVLILIDGMVFDVTRWLPEHPGGNSIIPTQALNVDGTVWFETYHASRKAFLYLEQFYIGDLVPEDLCEVPPAHGGLKEPSSAFLETLRDFTRWRVPPRESKGHIGNR